MPRSRKSSPTRRSRSPTRSCSCKRTQRKRSKTPSPGKGATREKTEVYYLAKAYKTLRGSPLAKFVRGVRQSKKRSK